jgi:tryptophan-rich sensory protein
MNKSLNIKLLTSLALPLGIGSLAGIFTAEAVPGWYATLKRPLFNPPNWLFGPVWIALYLIMGISLFLIWKKSASKEARSRSYQDFYIGSMWKKNLCRIRWGKNTQITKNRQTD